MTDTLEQLIVYETMPRAVENDIGTYASLLYTPPFRGPSHGPFGGIRFDPLPRVDISPLRPLPLASVEEIMARIRSEAEYKTRFAKNAAGWGYGTIENINVDRENNENIKIYSDALNNALGVGHENHGEKHTKKSYLELSELYPIKYIKTDGDK